MSNQRPSFAKRDREMKLKQKAREKIERRAAKRAAKSAAPGEHSAEATEPLVTSAQPPLLMPPAPDR